MRNTLAFVHPPVYRWRDGRVSYLVQGADGEGDDSGGGSGGDDNTDDDGADEDSSEGDKGDGDGTQSAVTREEFEALRKRMQAADRAKSEAQKKLDELQNKDKSELDQTKARLQTLEAENAKLREGLTDARLENAFANVEGIKWKRPGAALKLARADGFLEDVLNEDGDVDERAMARKVKEFAKQHDYMVDGEEKKKDTNQPPPPSGGAVGSTKSGGNGKPGGVDDAAIQKRYSRLLR